MTLSHLKQELKISNELLFNIILENNATENVKIINLSSLATAYDILKRTNLFDDTLKFYETSEYYGYSLNTLVLKSQLGKNFYNQIIDLRVLTMSLFNILDNLLKEVPDNTIFIKIVEPKDLQGLDANIHKFKLALEPLITHEDIGGSLIFHGVEPGSTWIKIGLETLTAVTLVAAIVTVVFKVYNHYQFNKYQDEILKGAKLDNNQKEALIKGRDQLFDLMIEAESKELYDNHYKKDNKDRIDQINRIQYAIKSITEEYNKGAQIIPQLNAPSEIKSMFPAQNLLKSGAENSIIEKLSDQNK